MAIKIQGSTIIDDSRNIVSAGIATINTKIDVGAGGTIFSADANVSNDNILSVKNTSDNPAFDITGTGSVGIGITNPSKSLHVDGTGMLVASGSTTLFSVETLTGNDNILSVKNTSLNPAFDITGTGSVGIGITNPSKSLHVDGTGMLVASGSTTLFSVETFTGNENVFEIYDRNDNIILGVTTNNIGIGSTNKFTITPQGNGHFIGVGGTEIIKLQRNTGIDTVFSALNSSNQQLFAVEPSGTVSVGSTNKFTITPQGSGHFIGVGGTEIVKLERNTTNSNIFSVLDSQNASVFSITTSGSIGIGSTQPDGIFEVRSNSNQLFTVKDIVSTDIFKILDSGGDPIVNVTTSGIAITASDGVSIYSTVTTYGDYDVYGGFSVGVGTTNRVVLTPETTQLSVGIDTTNFLTLGTNTGSEDTFTIYDSTGGLTHFTATNAGNIGIGISNPSQKLHIEGGNVLVSNGSTTIFSVNQTGTNILSIEDASSNPVFEVTSSGSVGIGLTNPTGIFEIEQSGNQLFQVSNTGSNSLSITDVSSNPAFDVTSSGKVGVGVTNPSANFEVVSAGSTVFSVNDTVGNYYLEIDTDKFVVTAAGDVGIGTSNPTSKLHIVGGLAFTDLNVSGISTLGTVQISSGIVTATSGIVTYYGDGSQLEGITAGGGVFDGFNTGITSAISATLTGIGTTVLTLPATSGKQYIFYSIHASNVATGNTEVNVIGAFDYNGGERTYFGYNVPIPTGTAIEMLKQPHILNPSDRITMRSTDYDRVGTDDIVEVYITYQETTSSDYFGVGLGTVGIGLTTPIGIHTATTYPSIIESINLVNRTDTGAYPVSITITSGVVTTYLVDNLIVPKYGAVEILDTPKRLNVNDVLSIQVDQTETIDVQVSGKKVV